MQGSLFNKLLSPANRFIRQEFSGGVVLLASVVIAMVWANSSWGHFYHTLWDMPLSIGLGQLSFSRPLHAWINDGLMAVFFFVIGLELKREFMAGELSTARKAVLPMAAALGGMLAPALLFLLFNHGLPSSGGWGIPMATDIAFALGLLSLTGKRIPSSVKVFLSALAVADDLGAVIVIALFYTAQLALVPLGIAAVMLALLCTGNLLGIRHTAFYLVGGILVWYLFLLSGVHATVAGVLVAFTIPARTRADKDEYLAALNTHSGEFEAASAQSSPLVTATQHRAIEKIRKYSLDATTPLQKIEYALHPWVAFFIMPLFALANAGIHMDHSFYAALQSPVFTGVALGLVAGKFAGVLCATWLTIKLKAAALPAGANWKRITGVAMLAGVGFTMSLFITGLAFSDPRMIVEAKYGILAASLISGTAGVLFLRSAKSK